MSVVRQAHQPWKECKPGEVAEINPFESLKKGAIAKKIPMEVLQPFTKKIPKYEIERYNGGVKFRNGDTLVARITPSLENGKTSFVDILEENEIGFGSTEFIVLREKNNESDKHFLYYLALSPEFREIAISSMTGSSGRQRVQNDVVFAHDFLLPPLPEQKAIATVLSSLDDKIDLLHRQNKTLEAMAEALFRQWFVLRQAQQPEDADEGWGEGTLGDLCVVITKGTTPTTLGHQFTETGVNFVKAESITDTGDFIWEKFAKISAETHKYLSRSILQDGDILCSIAGTIGRIAITTSDILPANTNKAIAILRANLDKCYPEFIYLFMKSSMFREVMDGKIVHAVQPNLSLGEIGNSSLRISPLFYLMEFKSTIQPLFRKKRENYIQIRTLEKLRDILLPKLMSGEVRVKI